MSPIARARNTWRRCGLYALSAVFFLQAALWALLLDDEPFLPLAWPILSLAAAIALFAFATEPTRDRLYLWAGVASFSAYIARPIGVGARWLNGDVLGPRLLIGVIAYTLLALGIGFFWVRSVGPWHDAIKAGSRKG